MIITEPKSAILEFLRAETGSAPHAETCQVLGWLNTEGQLTGALAYYNLNKRAVTVDLALLGGVYPRSFLYLTFWYPFTQLGVCRLTIFVAASNLKSIRLVERLGGCREATLQDGCSSGDLHVYCLRPENCSIWSKLNGQKRFNSSGSA